MQNILVLLLRVMQTGTMKTVLIFGLFAAACAALGSAQECLPYKERLDCHPASLTSGDLRTKCEDMGCTWCDAEMPNWGIPNCFLPKSYGYKMEGEPVNTGHGFRVSLRRATNISMFGSDSEQLTLEADFQSDYRLRIKITDGTKRYEVPLQVDPPQGGNSNLLYDMEFSNEPLFSFKVTRKSTGTVLIDTSLGGLTFSDQFLQFSTRLPSENLYGIGENEQSSFKHSFERYPLWILFNNEGSPQGNANIYGSQPYYTVVENDGNTHSVAIVNSNAQEFVVLPTPGLLYRTIGGIIDMYIFLGPTPENTVQQYTEAVGRQAIPPYWSLGFQLCKYGYNNLETMKATVDRMAEYSIPHDVQYGDIDIMDGNKDFTVSPDRFGGLPEYVKELHARGIKFMTILDPAISSGELAGSYRPFDLGNENDVWIKKQDGSTVLGRVWPEAPVAFPDFSKNSTRSWWIELIKEFHEVLEWDALWIDMNEPANFINGDLHDGCAVNKYNNPPYTTHARGGYLPSKTLCMDHKDSLSVHYDTHVLYGWLESEPTLAGVEAALPGKRGLVLSRSTYLGTGRWAAHWLGDNWSQWSNLKLSIVGTLQFNQFGVPLVGPDICGHQGNAEQEMCQRWSLLGAFYPFSRNHNAYGNTDQDPAVWGPEFAASIRKALEIRYTILPYLYTLFYYHFTQGSTVARALWHEFPADNTALNTDSQFLLGPGFLVSAVIEPGQTSVNAYFPDARWFNYHDGSEISVKARGASVTLPAPLDFINLHVRGGVIYPTQEPAVNTELSRQNPFGLIIALGDNDEAEGRMYYDDGDLRDPVKSGKYYLVKHTYANGELSSVVENNGWPRMSEMKLDTIRLLGASENVSAVQINNKDTMKVTKMASGEVLVQGLNLTMTDNHTIRFF